MGHLPINELESVKFGELFWKVVTAFDKFKIATFLHALGPFCVDSSTDK